MAAQLQINNSIELIRLNNDLKQGFYPLNTFNNEDGWASIKDLSASKRDFEYEYKKERPYQIREFDQTEKPNRLKDTQSEKTYFKFSPKSRIILSK